MRAVPQPLPSDLLGSTEAAALIGVERSTLTRWMDKGLIKPALRLTSSNGALLFHRSEVERAAVEYQARLRKPVAEAGSSSLYCVSFVTSAAAGAALFHGLTFLGQ